MGFLQRRPKADLMYGASGTRKTTNIGRAAVYIHQKYQKKTRLVTADGGGFDVLLPLVRCGIILPWSIRNWPHLVESFDKASKGWWPIDPDDPSKGLRLTTPQEWSEIGLQAFEGLTSFGDAIMSYFSASGAILSQDPSYKWLDGETLYSGSNTSYYGEAQKQLYNYVHNSHTLPCEKVIWTALEGRGEEEGTRVPVFGPAIVGRKSTGKATQWFGNTFHCEMVVQEAGKDELTGQMKLKTEPVLYLRSHADPMSRIVFPCKTRAPYQYAHELPDYIHPPDIDEVYRRLDEMNERVDKDLSEGKFESPTQSSLASGPTQSVQPPESRGRKPIGG